MKINKYNRSILGLMEQCNTGSWCKLDEVEKELGEMRSEKLYLNNRYRDLLRKYEKVCKYIARYELIGVLCIISLICNAFLIVELH